MTARDRPYRRPPRLIVRTLAATFSAIAFVLVVVFVMLVARARDESSRVAAENLEAGRRVAAVLEQRRAAELAAALRDAQEIGPLGEHIAYLALTHSADEQRAIRDYVTTAAHELADRTRPDGLAVVDAQRCVVASLGQTTTWWPEGATTTLDRPLAGETFQTVRVVEGHAFFVVAVPLVYAGTSVGELHVVRRLDDRYAATLAALARANAAITVGGRIVASSLPVGLRAAYEQALATSSAASGRLRVNGERTVVSPVLRAGPATMWVLSSLDSSSNEATMSALRALALPALGAFLLGAVASLWLARTVSRPVRRLSRSLLRVAEEGRFDVRLGRTGTSRELDVLTDTFNELMHSLSAAQADTRAAYVGAIKALATALDARDPYTAGHSERVSALSVAIGRQMGLKAPEIEVIRLGALLHDIGKIGIGDSVLRKPGPLTPEEYDIIKDHARLGARILKSVPFLEPQLPIVELHHERPDGRGYPHGLSGDDIPLHSRIVRVADAFDAMTTPRAYRPARPPSEAFAELWQCAGSQFDATVVEALVAAWPSVSTRLHRVNGSAIPDTNRIRQAIAFSQKRSGNTHVFPASLP